MEQNGKKTLGIDDRMLIVSQLTPYSFTALLETRVKEMTKNTELCWEHAIIKKT